MKVLYLLRERYLTWRYNIISLSSENGIKNASSIIIYAGCQ